MGNWNGWRRVLLAAMLLTGCRTGSAPVPPSVDDTKLIALVAPVRVFVGPQNAYAIYGDGKMEAWGLNDQGQLGLMHARSPVRKPSRVKTGIIVDSDAPREPTAEKTWSTVAAARSHALALDSEFRLFGAGANQGGELGSLPPASSEFKQIGTERWDAIAAGPGYSLAIRNGRMYGGGEATSSPKQTLPDWDGKPFPSRIFTEITDFVDVSGGPDHVVASRSNGTLWAWGSEADGRLGVMKNTTHFPLYRVDASNDWHPHRFSAGGAHTLAQKKDGSVWGWGSNQDGQLGLGGRDRVRKPQKLRSGKWRMVASGRRHSLLLSEDGRVHASGNNSHGQLGTGDRTNASQFEQVGSLSNAVWIAAGDNWSVVVLNDGRVLTWGNDSSGQLGNGPGSKDQLTPGTVIYTP